jgi:uncharacterized protein YbjQ (UPF0145 family)
MALFTSDLSVSEYVLLEQSGFEPLGFVVGSSIYHIGLQTARWSQNQELGVLTRAMYDARNLAMGRLQVEADRLGADGVVGVRLELRTYAWGEHVMEFVATGTAVRATGGGGGYRTPTGKAFTSDLTVQDFYRLLLAGSVPVSYVMGTCVYHVAHQGVMQSLKQSVQNQEMPQFTNGVYEARGLAMSRMQTEATQAGATGVVGVHSLIASHVWGHHATEFFAGGTAIRRLAEGVRPASSVPSPTFTLGLDA